MYFLKKFFNMIFWLFLNAILSLEFFDYIIDTSSLSQILNDILS